MNPILFQETQRLKSPIIWILLILSVTPPLYELGHMIGMHDVNELKEMPVSNYFVYVALPIILFLIIYLLKLNTEITVDGISYQFRPLAKKETIIWRDVESVEIVKYRPMKDYGGWGARRCPSGTAVIISGNTGLKMKIKTIEKPFLIGTNKPEELRRVMESLRNKGKFN